MGSSMMANSKGSYPCYLGVFVVMILITLYLAYHFFVSAARTEVTEQLFILKESQEDDLRIESAEFEGVNVTLYIPNLVRTGAISPTAGRPAMVFYHGGGWVLFREINNNKSVSEVAQRTGIIIISVEYRLAPVNPFPEPFEDCYKVTKYVLNNYKKFGLDPKRIAIGGDSAGGNLAAAVALKLRDDNLMLRPKLQILIYPPLQAMDFLLPSYVQNKNGYLTQFIMVDSWCLYATGTNKYRDSMLTNNHTNKEFKHLMDTSYIDHRNIPKKFRYKPYKQNWINYGNEDIWDVLKAVLLNPYFAPLLAGNLSDLPPAYIYTGQYDILRDDGLLYVKRLRDAGILVEHYHAPKGNHGNFNAWHKTEEDDTCMNGVIEYLKNNL